MFIPRIKPLVKSIDPPVKSIGFCYSYKVLDAICLRVAYSANPADATYAWKYVDGCFENGEFAHYTQAKPGQTYEWSKLPIEIRETTT